MRYFTLILIALSAAPSFAQGPRVDRLERPGGQRGTEFTVVAHGELLGEVNNVLFYDEGLSLKKVEATDDASAAMTIAVGSDVLPGEYPLRLLSPSGVSDLKTLHISPYPQSQEAEPNNSMEEAQSVELGTTIHGIVEEGDVDLFRVTLKKGQRLSAEVVGIRNTQYVFDSRIAVLNESGEELTSNDDCPLLYQDPMMSFLAPTDGTYFVQIREAAFGGDLDSVYQLHIGEHPRPTVCYPAGGMAGSEQTFTLIGDAKGSVVVTRALPNSDGLISHYPEDRTGIAPSPIKLRVSSFPNSLETEPNNTPETASPSIVSLPVALNGILQEPGDVDHFRIKAKAGETYDVAVYGHRIGSPIDTVVSISNADGKQIIVNDDGANHDSRFRFSAPADGDYTLAVKDHLGHGGDDYVYRVEFQPVEPSLELAVPILSEQKQQLQQRVQLARGGRMAIVVSARRTNFLGNVQLSPDFLPDGVTVKASEITNASHLGYLLFEAADDAPLTAGMFGINGVATANDHSVIGKLNQKTGLAFGPPRRTVYHSVNVDQLPITVIENGPFQIDVEQPRVPLARDGQLDLKVTVRRNNYDGDLKLTLPILPPWIEVPEDGVEIPAGQDSTTFTITATRRAKPRDWTILMMAEGNIDGNEVFASSGEFTFTVVDPYLDVTIDKAIARKNSAGKIQCHATWMKTDSSVPAIARLRGLPKDVDVPEVTVPAGSDAFSFDISVGEDTPASIHNTLYVEVEVPENGSGVRHFLGRGGVLEVLAAGEKPRDSRSRLEILRAQAKNSQPTITTSTSD